MYVGISKSSVKSLIWYSKHSFVKYSKLKYFYKKRAQHLFVLQYVQEVYLKSNFIISISSYFYFLIEYLIRIMSDNAKY